MYLPENQSSVFTLHALELSRVPLRAPGKAVGQVVKMVIKCFPLFFFKYSYLSCMANSALIGMKYA